VTAIVIAACSPPHRTLAAEQSKHCPSVEQNGLHEQIAIQPFVPEQATESSDHTTPTMPNHALAAEPPHCHDAVTGGDACRHDADSPAQ
jgi:hypothetical protein